MSELNTCGKDKCKGWPSEVKAIDMSSNKPLLIYCRCDYPGNLCISCGIRATFGFVGTKCKLTCKTHSNNKFVNVANKRCLGKDCTKRPHFGFKKENKKIYCREHKLPEMMLLGARECEEQGCNNRALYRSLQNSDKDFPEFCREHKGPSMINTTGKRCEMEGCITSSSFNYPGEYPIRCFKHANDGMINIKAKTCLHADCGKQPNYNVPGETKGIYCFSHKTEDMRDVGHKICKHQDCITQANFNHPGTSIGFCAKHRTETMIKNPTKRCSIQGCTDVSTHGTAPDKPTPYVNYATHCDFHTTKDLKDLHNKPCVSCTMPYLLNFNSKCYFCDKANFEEHTKRKEIKVKEYLDSRGTIYSSHDQIIDGGKYGKERPDFLFMFLAFAIILEVDENQHFSRTCECEQIRMVNVFQALGVPTMFIRYNPDKYLPDGNNTKTEGDSFDKRMALLDHWIRTYTSTPPILLLTVGYLYFDGWNGMGSIEQIKC